MIKEAWLKPKIYGCLQSILRIYKNISKYFVPFATTQKSSPNKKRGIGLHLDLLYLGKYILQLKIRDGPGLILIEQDYDYFGY